MGIKASLAQNIIQCASNTVAMDMAVFACEDNPSDMDKKVLEAIQREQQAFPETFRRPRLPPIWNSGLDDDQCPQATMHILFGGS